MSTTETIQANPNATDAQIREIIRNDPSRYRPVQSIAVIAWLGQAARKVRLENWLAGYPPTSEALAATANPITADTSLQVLMAHAYGGISALLSAVGNTATFLTLDPASPQRQLLGLAVSLQIITAGDAQALIELAQITPDPTLEEIATERARLSKEEQRESLRRWVDDQTNKLRRIVESAESLPTTTELKAEIQV